LDDYLDFNDLDAFNDLHDASELDLSSTAPSQSSQSQHLYGGKMLVQSTQKFDTIEDAEDSLAGLKSLPCFVLGYILQTPITQVVFIANCTDGDLAAGQRLVTTIATNQISET
jgi:hypothetical protein